MRRLCSGTCGEYFDTHDGASYCDDCVKAFVDHDAQMICQDNKEPGDWLRPVDAMSLAKVRIENAQLVKELNEWKRFALSNFSTICSLAAPRLLPRDAQKLAEAQLSICYTDFKEIMAEVEGPVYRRRG